MAPLSFRKKLKSIVHSKEDEQDKPAGKNLGHDIQAPSVVARQQTDQYSSTPSINKSTPKQTPPAETSPQSVKPTSTLGSTPVEKTEDNAGDVPTKSLWDEAFDALESEEPDQVKAYTELLSRRLVDAEGEKATASDHLVNGLISDDRSKRQEQLRRITDLGVKRAEDKRLKITIAGHSFYLRDQALSMTTFHEWATENLKDVMTNIPYVGAVWLGFAVVLPLIVNPSAEEENNKSGFTFVSLKMRYYNKMEELLFPPTLPPGVKKEMKERLVELYKSILDFQVRTILHLYRSRAGKYFRGVIKYDDWEAKRQGIEDQEKEIRDQFNMAMTGTQVASTITLTETLDNMRDEALQAHRALQDTLNEMAETLRQTALKTEEIASNTNDITKQNEEILKHHKNIEKIELSKQQQQCLHSLFVTDASADKERIASAKGGLIDECSAWILSHETFESWRNIDHHGTRTLWVHGGPGQGKTMLLICMINHMERPRTENGEDTLLAYFFCQASDDNLNNATAVLRGLIHQLVVLENNLVEYIQEIYNQYGDGMYEGPNAFYTLSVIFKNMLEHASKKVCLIIDALDECESGQEDLLDLISNTPSAKWIVSSRITPEIEEQLGDDEYDGSKVNLNISSETANAIKTYIDLKVDELKTLKDAELREEVRQILNEKADGTFLWVALVCKELERARRAQRVKEVLSGVPKGLYPLYERMLETLKQAEASDYDCCQMALSISVLAKAPLHWKELQKLADLEDSCPDLEDVQNIVDMCGSFLVLREDYVYFVHLSAKEYLVTKPAAADIFPDGTDTVHFDIFTRSLECLEDVLCQDIYELEDPGISISDIETPPEKPLEIVQYAAAFWADHFCAAMAEEIKDSAETSRWVDAASDSGMILSFFQEHFLHWIESLSLLHRMSNMIRGTRHLSKTVNAAKGDKYDVSEGLRDFLVDAERFGLRFRPIMEQVPLQIYASALVFCPEETEIKRLFWDQRAPVIESIDGNMDKWDLVTTIFGTQEGLDLPTFSPDDKIVAGFDRSEWQVAAWDVETGGLLFTKQFKTAPTSLAFWPDAQTLAVSTKEGLALCNSTTGAVKRTILRPDACDWEEIAKEAFSSDGKTVAFGLRSGQLLLWDSVGGKLRELSNGRLPDSPEWKRALEFVFSPDGKAIAVASQDSSQIYLIDTARSAVLHVIATGDDELTAQTPSSSWDGHKLTFSPDGKTLAAESKYTSIMVWDKRTGKLLDRCSMEYSLRSMGFVDGKRILFLDRSAQDASLRNGTVGIYNVGESKATYGETIRQDGLVLSPTRKLVGLHTTTFHLTTVDALLQPQEADSQRQEISHVCFSPDLSTFLVEGGEGVRLWDSESGEVRWDISKAALEAWPQAAVEFSIFPKVFSPDGTKLACPTETPGGVFLFDLETEEVEILADGPTELALAFSPDSELLITADDLGVSAIRSVANHKVLYTTAACIYGTSAFFSADSKLVVLPCVACSRAEDGLMLEVVDALTGASVSTVEQKVRHCCISADSEYLGIVPWSDHRSVQVASVVSGEIVQTIAIDRRIHGVTLSPDSGTVILSTGRPDTRLYFCERETGKVQLDFPVKPMHELDTNQLEWTSRMAPGSSVVAKVSSCENEIDASHSDSLGRYTAPVVKMGLTREEITFIPWQHFGLQVFSDWVRYDGKNILWLPPAYQNNDNSAGGHALAVLVRDSSALTQVRFNL